MTPKSANNLDDQQLFKMLGKVLLPLYLAYAAFHTFSGVVRGCDLRFTFLLMSPVRELLTIPMVDKAFDFTKPSANDNPAPELTALAGWGIGSVIKSALTIENCLLFAGLLDMQTREDQPRRPAAPAPAATPWHIKFSPPKHGEMKKSSAPMWTAVSGMYARQKGRCTKPTVLVENECRYRYGVRCGKTHGYIDKAFMRMEA